MCGDSWFCRPNMGRVVLHAQKKANKGRRRQGSVMRGRHRASLITTGLFVLKESPTDGTQVRSRRAAGRHLTGKPTASGRPDAVDLSPEDRKTAGGTTGLAATPVSAEPSGDVTVAKPSAAEQHGSGDAASAGSGSGSRTVEVEDLGGLLARNILDSGHQ